MFYNELWRLIQRVQSIKEGRNYSFCLTIFLEKAFNHAFISIFEELSFILMLDSSSSKHSYNYSRDSLQPILDKSLVVLGNNE